MDDFAITLNAEVDLVKSEQNGKRIIRGIASTSNPDQQGESLVQKGLDVSYLLSKGWFNYDHDNTKILGYPTSADINDERMILEGVLLEGVPLADHVWNVACALAKSNSPRRLGFSVEGKVLERDKDNPKKILKAKIYNCAITPNPVNTEATWDVVVKSFRGEMDINVLKALEAGYGVTPEEQIGGGALRREDLEEAIKILSYTIDDPAVWSDYRSKLAANGGKITKAEAVVYLQLAKGLSRSEAQRIVNSFED